MKEISDKLADRLEAIKVEISNHGHAIEALRTESRAIHEELERRRLDALISKLPAVVLDALRQSKPRREDMPRLRARKLAETPYGGEAIWTHEGKAVRARMGVSNG